MKIEQLIKLADFLDSKGEFDAASEIDDLIQKHAVETVSNTADASDDESMTDLSQKILQSLTEIEQKMNEQVTVQMSPQKRQAELNVVFQKLARVANELDKTGARKEADMIDEFLSKHAKKDLETDQNKGYDSKHNHSLLVREPKKKQERANEGGEEHSVHNYKQTNTKSLSTRYCPDHIGVTLARVGDCSYQCPLDGQVYNWEIGWKDQDGVQHPGGSVAAQTPDSTGYEAPHRLFDSRDSTINRIN